VLVADGAAIDAWLIRAMTCRTVAPSDVAHVADRRADHGTDRPLLQRPFIMRSLYRTGA
jgi:hypothetical protein